MGIIPDKSNRKAIIAAVNNVLPVTGGDGVLVTYGGGGTTIGLTSRPRGRNIWLGIVVCQGPNSDDFSGTGNRDNRDFDDQRYWVSRANVVNANDNPHQALVETAEWEELPADHPDHLVRMAENLFEYNCGTHYVRPGTPVMVFDTTDEAGLTKSFVIVADEGTCNGDPCATPSSQSHSSRSTSSASSASSASTSISGAQCVWMWTIEYDCSDSGWDDVTFRSGACVTPPGTPNTWQQLHGCTYVYYQTNATACRTTGDCELVPPPPDPPSFTPNCCSSVGSVTGSGSGSHVATLKCIYAWTCEFDCFDSGWDNVHYVTSACQIPPPTVNAWVQYQGCTYIYYAVGTNCSSDGDCGSNHKPQDPDGPDFVPACCSSGSSGSSASGSSGTGGCNCARKTISVVTDVQCVDGQIQVTKEDVVVFDDGGSSSS